QGLQSGETLSEVFSYEITDADGDTATATLTLTINGVNDAPVAVIDRVVTTEDTAVAGNLLGNDSDIDGDPLEVTQV
ncbi:Ig-like domain-containing protein, partial [Rhodalgimonas zhirmunskyi]